jgi:hypothetical protein
VTAGDGFGSRQLFSAGAPIDRRRPEVATSACRQPGGPASNGVNAPADASHADGVIGAPGAGFDRLGDAGDIHRPRARKQRSATGYPRPRPRPNSRSTARQFAAGSTMGYCPHGRPDQAGNTGSIQPTSHASRRSSNRSCRAVSPRLAEPHSSRRATSSYGHADEQGSEAVGGNRTNTTCPSSLQRSKL